MVPPAENRRGRHKHRIVTYYVSKHMVSFSIPSQGLVAYRDTASLFNCRWSGIPEVSVVVNYRIPPDLVLILPSLVIFRLLFSLTGFLLFYRFSQLDLNTPDSLCTIVILGRPPRVYITFLTPSPGSSILLFNIASSHHCLFVICSQVDGGVRAFP